MQVTTAAARLAVATAEPLRARTISPPNVVLPASHNILCQQILAVMLGTGNSLRQLNTETISLVL